MPSPTDEKVEYLGPAIRCPSYGGPRVRIPFPPPASLVRTWLPRSGRRKFGDLDGTASHPDCRAALRDLTARARLWRARRTTSGWRAMTVR